MRVHGAAARETDGGRCFAEGCRWLYGFGEGVDYTEAASYLKRGAQLGHALSAAHLASILMEGKGVRGNPRAAQLEATMWAMRSCDAMGLNDQAAGGDAGARLALGLLLQAGIGCEMNQALAVNHFRAAAMAGDAVVGGESSEDTRESGGGRIRLPGQVGDTTARNAGIQELS